MSIDAQGLYIGVNGGAAMYNGDLSHHNPFFSQNEVNRSLGMTAGYVFNNTWSVGFSYLTTTIEGSDTYANSKDLQSRNLSFYSDIKELSITSQFHFLNKLNVSTKYISPYLEGGLGVFHFNPMANYEGLAYELQELNTEGQGLPGNNLSPYQLIEMNYQIGAGMTFKIKDRLRFSFSSIIRFTTTDYLDDVSGSYYDINKLAIYKGEVAAKMAYRSAEVSNDLPESIHGNSRGNPGNNDSYIIHQFSVSYLFGKKSN